jgi:hypothetical protein
MSPIQFTASVAHVVLALRNEQQQTGVNPPAPVALEITAVAPFGFAYTKVRLDTGEAVWRWPHATPAVTPTGGIVDLSV